MTNQNRYEVIADYPGTHHVIGEIITPRTKGMELSYSKYPHLFRLLKWWEHVPVDELPKYVKLVFSSGIAYCHKVVEWVGVNSNNVPLYSYYNRVNYLSTMCVSELHPATEAEYTDYLTKLNSK